MERREKTYDLLRTSDQNMRAHSFYGRTVNVPFGSITEEVKVKIGRKMIQIIG